MDNDKGRVHLDMVALHFSTRCGAACGFCYSAHPIGVQEEPTPISEIRQILHKLANEEVREVLFVGGDPVVHPAFTQSVLAAKSEGLGVSVLSNSWAIRPLGQFDATVQAIDNCEATVHGPDSKAHDNVTQRQGSFVNLLANLRRVASLGKSIGICMNATPSSVGTVHATVARLSTELAGSLKSLMIQRVIPSGAAAAVSGFGLRLEDIDTLMREVDQVANEFEIPIVFEDPVPWCTVDPRFHKYLGRCEWGFTRGALNSKAELNRCAADDVYRLGSIWDEHVQTTWLENPILQSFRSRRYLSNECMECELLQECGGGCSLSCGTHQDHRTDQLFKQRISEGSLQSTPCRDPDSERIDQSTTRCGRASDLLNIVTLDREIFGPSEFLLTQESIQLHFDNCPSAFRVAIHCGQLVGYSVLAPLSDKGIQEVEVNGIRSIAHLAKEQIGTHCAGEDDALFLEVIACLQVAPFHLRCRLLADLMGTVNRSSGPVFTCPISETGLDLVQRTGFKPLGARGVGEIYALRGERRTRTAGKRPDHA